MRFFFLLFAVVFAYSVETELYYDDGSSNGWSGPGTSIDGRHANDFIAPFVCHASKIKIYPHYLGGLGQTTAYVWNDNSGYPGSILGQKDFTGLLTGNWCTLDIGSLNITVASGQTFYCGVKLFQGSQYIEQLGYDTDHLPLHYYFASGNGGVTWLLVQNHNLMARCIIDNDMTPPYVNGQVPAPQSNVTPPLSSIVFHCRDDDKGVDPDTIVFSCTGNGNPIPGTLDKDTSNLHDVICTFTPNTPIPGGICVLCNVHSGLADGLGNATTSDITWWFTVGANKVRQNSLGELKAIFHE